MIAEYYPLLFYYYQYYYFIIINIYLLFIIFLVKITNNKIVTYISDIGWYGFTYHYQHLVHN